MGGLFDHFRISGFLLFVGSETPLRLLAARTLSFGGGIEVRLRPLEGAALGL
jgi:hypothetical protein